MKTKTIRKILLAVLALGLLLGGGYVGRHQYLKWRQARLVEQARSFLAQADTRNALLSLKRALEFNPSDIEACRLMARLTKDIRSPSTLLWHSRVVELDPRSLDDRLALAQTAMTMRDYATATNALERVDPAGKRTAAYHKVAGSVASSAKRLAEAESHFLEAVRLEPNNPDTQLNLAVVRLKSTNAPALAEARTSLKLLASNVTNSVLRCQALRELAIDAANYQKADAALALSRQLLQDTNSVFRDRLLRLDVLLVTKNDEFKPALASFQKEAAEDPAKIHELARWQMAKTRPEETLAWLGSLPLNIQTNQPVALLLAECHSMLKDWRGLHAFLQPQNWGELEFLRHAFQTRALRRQGLSDAAKAEWELAFKAASGQKQGLAMLLRMTAQWNWQNESEELLWTIVNRYPSETWAGPALVKTLVAGGRTRSLMTLFSQQLKRTPTDLALKNNLAVMALLLDAKELKPHELAREVYEHAPTNSFYASTYAFSLHLQEKSPEALKIIERLKPKELEDPSMAGYYGLILQATGNRATAKKYLELASKAKQLLPEERKLFERAMTRT